VAHTPAAVKLGGDRRINLIPLVAVSVGVVILLGLGVWQVQRLQWKTALLARIAALQSAPSEPLEVVLHRIKDGGEVDFVRVQTTCPSLQQTRVLHLYAILDGVMGDRAITACPIAAGPYRTLLVDRGFVPADQVARIAPGPPTPGPVIGVLRKTEKPNWLSPPNSVLKNDWHTRDIPAMAAALNAPAPAPVILMLERPGPTGFGPRPAAIPTDIPNNHLGYALTWFGLAIGLVVSYIGSFRRAKRVKPRP
jgi:surfeit locus 1 family protein